MTAKRTILIFVILLLIASMVIACQPPATVRADEDPTPFPTECWDFQLQQPCTPTPVPTATFTPRPKPSPTPIDRWPPIGG